MAQTGSAAVLEEAPPEVVESLRSISGRSVSQLARDFRELGYQPPPDIAVLDSSLRRAARSLAFRRNLTIHPQS
jgi:hypothetical protein